MNDVIKEVVACLQELRTRAGSRAVKDWQSGGGNLLARAHGEATRSYACSSCGTSGQGVTGLAARGEAAGSCKGAVSSSTGSAAHGEAARDVLAGQSSL